ncbi:ABC transporter substrate-binding protein [Specibacter cremeus]|uniref:ABC transporter substrate-binding protein n=1 Tax=Specibacter cremeus TaxID=1629051 RepID=UPI000F78390E|nr:ABC transporter substrate-binding protein [Specibacter cremeus]
MPQHNPDNEPLATTRIVAGQKPQRPTKARKRGLEIAAVAGLVVLIGAGAAVASVTSQSHDAVAAQPTPAASLRLGYFGNVTHAPALVGLQEGLFAKALGGTTLSTEVFNAGPAAIEALNAGAIDAAYVGPNPAINSYVKSHGDSIRIVAGATAGGAQLVVKPTITTAAQLLGKVLASPQLGGTQDVALRSWLADQGFKTTPGGGGDVTINPTDNAQTLRLFQDGKLDGAWLPEPWASRLVLQAGAKVLVNEGDLWAKGQFSTTVLIVNKSYLDAHPQTVQALLAGHVQAVTWLNTHQDQTAKVINAGLATAAGKPLADNVIARSLTELKFSADPLAVTFPTLLAHGVKAGVTKQADINGIFDLTPLNAALRQAGQPTVNAAGLGTN